MILKKLIRREIVRHKYRKLNIHNYTTIRKNCDINKITVGKNTYGAIDVVNQSDGDYFLKIGSYCSISDDVHFLVAGEHNIKTISTYPFKAMCFTGEKEAGSKGSIVIDDDVWIGYGAIICSGVHIGRGAVIAAGAIVTKDVEPYAIVGGNPAKIIRYRFNEALREELMKVNIVDLFDSFKESDLKLIYSEITDDSLFELIHLKK